MSIQVKYNILYRGAYIDQAGEIISSKSANTAVFESEEAAHTFIENNLPSGEYTLSSFIIKTEE